MGYGDEILAAGEAQRWFDVSHQRSQIIDLDGRRRWHPIWEGNPIIVRPGESADRYYSILNAPHARPYIVYPFTEDTGWTFNRQFRARDCVARIYLTDDELQIGRNLCDQVGLFVLIDSWSKHANLRWPLEHWTALVTAHPELTWVQHTWGSSPRVPGATCVIHTPSFREACGLLASASLYIRGESGMCHAAAALGIPQVTIWGGCMDWDVLGGYPKQIGVGVSDQPCGSYRACPHCQLAMAAISVEDVSHAIDAQLACYTDSA